MSERPFSREELGQIESTLSRTTNLDSNHIMKIRDNKAIKQCSYLIGHEIRNLKTLIERGGDTIGFGAPLRCLDQNLTVTDRSMNQTGGSYHHGNVTYLNQLLAVSREIWKCVNKVLQSKMKHLLYTESRFHCYSRETMAMERDSIIENIKSVETLILEDKMKYKKSITDADELLADMNHIYVARANEKYQLVSSCCNMEALEKDFKQQNQDMMNCIFRHCGDRKSAIFFKTLFEASKSENEDDKYVSVQCVRILPYLVQMEVVLPHPNNHRLVKLASNKPDPDLWSLE